MVTQDPMNPDPEDVRSAADVFNVEPVDPRRTPCVEPIVANTDKPESVGGLAGVVIVLSGVVLVGSCMVMQPSMGSTRSAWIEWQRRQLEIEEVLDDEGSKHSIDEAESHAP